MCETGIISWKPLLGMGAKIKNKIKTAFCTENVSDTKLLIKKTNYLKNELRNNR